MRKVKGAFHLGHLPIILASSLDVREVKSSNKLLPKYWKKVNEKKTKKGRSGKLPS